MAETMKKRLDKFATKVDGAVKRVDSSKAALKRVIVENFNLEAIREGQAKEIRKLKVALKVVEEEMREADKSRARAIASKAIKDF